MTARQLYALAAQSVSYDLYWPLEAHRHVHEICLSEIPEGANERVSVRILEDHAFDDRRYWLLFTVWLDDTPVMICQNAGREGKDHSARYVTDPDAYAQMLAYLASLVQVESLAEQDVQLDDEAPQLTCFHGGQFRPAPDAA